MLPPTATHKWGHTRPQKPLRPVCFTTPSTSVSPTEVTTPRFPVTFLTQRTERVYPARTTGSHVRSVAAPAGRPYVMPKRAELAPHWSNVPHIRLRTQNPCSWRKPSEYVSYVHPSPAPQTARVHASPDMAYVPQAPLTHRVLSQAPVAPLQTPHTPVQPPMDDSPQSPQPTPRFDIESRRVTSELPSRPAPAIPQVFDEDCVLSHYHSLRHEHEMSFAPMQPCGNHRMTHSEHVLESSTPVESPPKPPLPEDSVSIPSSIFEHVSTNQRRTALATLAAVIKSYRERKQMALCELLTQLNGLADDMGLDEASRELLVNQTTKQELGFDIHWDRQLRQWTEQSAPTNETSESSGMQVHVKLPQKNAKFHWVISAKSDSLLIRRRRKSRSRSHIRRKALSLESSTEIYSDSDIPEGSASVKPLSYLHSSDVVREQKVVQSSLTESDPALRTDILESYSLGRGEAADSSSNMAGSRQSLGRSFDILDESRKLELLDFLDDNLWDIPVLRMAFPVECHQLDGFLCRIEPYLHCENLNDRIDRYFRHQGVSLGHTVESPRSPDFLLAGPRCTRCDLRQGPLSGPRLPHFGARPSDCDWQTYFDSDICLCLDAEEAWSRARHAMASCVRPPATPPFRVEEGYLCMSVVQYCMSVDDLQRHYHSILSVQGSCRNCICCLAPRGRLRKQIVAMINAVWVLTMANEPGFYDLWLEVVEDQIAVVAGLVALVRSTAVARQVRDVVNWVQSTSRRPRPPQRVCEPLSPEEVFVHLVNVALRFQKKCLPSSVARLIIRAASQLKTAHDNSENPFFASFISTVTAACPWWGSTRLPMTSYPPTVAGVMESDAQISNLVSTTAVPLTPADSLALSIHDPLHQRMQDTDITQSEDAEPDIHPSSHPSSHPFLYIADYCLRHTSPSRVLS